MEKGRDKPEEGGIINTMNLSHKLFHAIDGREHRLVLVCTAHQVSASMLYIQKNEASQVVAHTYQVVENIQVDASEEEVFDAIFVTLKEVCEDISLKAHRVYANSDMADDHQAINAVSFYLSGPYLSHRFYNEDVQWESPTIVSQEIINVLAQKDIPQGYARLGCHPSSVSLNGYTIAPEEAIGKTASSARVSLTESLVRFHYAESLFQLVHTIFNINEQQVRLFGLHQTHLHHAQQYRALRGDYVVCGIYGLTTEITVFQGNHISVHDVFLFGTETLVVKLQQAGLAFSTSQARSLLMLWSQNNLDQSLHQTVKEILSQEIDHLNQEIQNRTTALQEVPQEWHLYGNRGVIEALGSVLKEHYKKILIQQADKAGVVNDATIDYPTSHAIQYEVDHLYTDTSY